LAGANPAAPASDEIEVSLFGPGFGESILIHIGADQWVIVDSCLDKTKRPAPLAYLETIGVLPAKVKLILASHWHDDHVRGLSEIFTACQEAEFFCSNALIAEEFLQLVACVADGAMIEGSSGISEFGRILAVLEGRKKVGIHSGPHWAIADRVLWRGKTNPVGGEDIEISALSPSDQEVVLSKVALAKLLPSPKTPKRRIVPSAPNHTAVVVTIKIGGSSILLGSDLEEKGDNASGWSAIVKAARFKSSVIKIPHHGSKTAEHPKIWSELVAADAVGILTPFSRGSVNLPNNEDVLRIKKNLKHIFITCPPKIKAKKPDGAVSKTLMEMGVELRQIPLGMGQVRLRKKISETTSAWDVQLFGSACAA
jgi:hypothetical protein